MHSFTPSDVASDDFDLSSLLVSQNDTNKLIQKISGVRVELEKKKKALAPKNAYYWVSENEVIDACDFINDQHYLSMIFSSDFLKEISTAISGNRYHSWYVFSRMNTWLAHNSSLAKKALFHSSTDQDIKANIVNNNLVQVEELIQSIQNKAALSFPSNIQERLLEICDPSDAATFVNSDYDKIRLLAYQKIGPLSHLDDMIKDPHALLRRYAVRLLSPGDQRLASFINDRSQDVFIQALSKISISLIPMMLGSSHLKKKRAKEVLNHRLQSAQS